MLNNTLTRGKNLKSRKISPMDSNLKFIKLPNGP